MATFRRADLEHLDFAVESFDMVIASNSLEHLHSPAAFVEGLSRWLTPGGIAIIAIPPILSADDLAVHAGISYHRSNLTVAEWHSLFANAGCAVTCFSHRAGTTDVRPDFSSRRTSRLTVGDFVFVPTDLAGLHARPSITAVFEVRPPAGR